MPSPFPGMDPYLEHPYRWPSIHTQLISGLPAVIEPVLPERYTISVEERVYLTVPGDAIRLRQPDAIVLDTGTGGPSGGAPVATLPNAVEVLLPEDETVREHYLEIRDPSAENDLITVIEALSPTNKSAGPGREEYLNK